MQQIRNRLTSPGELKLLRLIFGSVCLYAATLFLAYLSNTRQLVWPIGITVIIGYLIQGLEVFLFDRLSYFIKPNDKY